MSRRGLGSLYGVHALELQEHTGLLDPGRFQDVLPPLQVHPVKQGQKLRPIGPGQDLHLAPDSVGGNNLSGI